MVHEGPFISLHRDEVLRPDGAAGVYEHVVVKDSVRVVALDDEGRVVLVEDDFYLQQRRVLHLPGGGCAGQDPLDAARRELEEETGQVAGDLRLLASVDPLPATTRAKTHLVVATHLRPGTVQREGTETGMTVEWWTLDDAVAAARTGRITEAASVIALLLTEHAQA
ncbi:NUDIX hydrolase [Streptomyces sp. ME02-8801-2C]|uniref:NUDIX hydrolase n=1 Tax=Streptomyces sp. ME02-8801-2C TaxID=3028680 RepID=UPI0029A13EEB|nr:NUDIX hydrolase [Streptomyces sp. ME02-8801-2C]MDX3452101.1 NUDIX hydrolase [Streptomyces sp. ME02-8801-2C]